ncbi:hypothetical protein Ancab_006677 [Ancistrocladus abbreviatus]
MHLIKRGSKNNGKSTFSLLSGSPKPSRRTEAKEAAYIGLEKVDGPCKMFEEVASSLNLQGQYVDTHTVAKKGSKSGDVELELLSEPISTLHISREEDKDTRDMSTKSRIKKKKNLYVFYDESLPESEGRQVIRAKAKRKGRKGSSTLDRVKLFNEDAFVEVSIDNCNIEHRNRANCVAKARIST